MDNDGGGPAVRADSAQVSASIQLIRLHAATDGDDSVLRLIRVHTASVLSLEDVRLENPGGAAINALALSAGGLLLGPGLETIGAVTVSGAHIRGEFTVSGATIRDSVPARLRIDLTQTTVDGQLRLPVAELAGQGGPLALDGLRYPEVPQPASVTDWLTLLREHTPGYAAQPYQQLAAVHRAAGHECDAIRILIAQQRDLGARGQLAGRPARAWHRVSGFALGYGYRPARAFAGLLAALAIAVVLAFGAGGAGLTTRTAPPAGPCNAVEQLGMAANLSIPLVRWGAPQRCEYLTDSAAGQWLVVGGWCTQLLGWSCATLFVAGFTGLVRRT